MDKYLIKMNKDSPVPDKNAGSRIRKLKQTKLEHSPKVVVIEKIETAKQILKTETDAEVLAKCLEDLAAKLPPIEVLQSTKIGGAVKKLCTHEHSKVSDCAKSLVAKWTEHIKTTKSKRVIDVRCDTKTEERRSTARKLLRQSLTEPMLEQMAPTSSEDPDSEEVITLNDSGCLKSEFHVDCQKLSQDLEWEAFNYCNKNLHNGYPKTIRTLFRSLRTMTEIREKLLSNQMSVKNAFHDLLKK